MLSSTRSTSGSLISFYNVVPPDVQPHILTTAVLLDLNLMRHYALTTSLMLCGRPRFTSIWQDTVPREAESHPFLMHGLLALTALDIAQSDPSRQQFYFDLAIRHQHIGITLFRPILSELTEGNASAVFAYSSVAVITAFAIPQVFGAMPSDPIADILEIFKLMRGIHAVVNAASGWIDRGGLGPLIRSGRSLISVPVSAEVEDSLRVLEERNRLSTEDELVREVYSSAIGNLRSMFEHQDANTSSRVPTFSWPIIVTSAYPVAVARREPMALAILAHYGVIINGICECWWIGTWGKWIIKTVARLLDEEWQSLIRWPKEKIAMN